MAGLLGLDAVAESVYRTLLRSPALSAEDLVDELGEPEDAVHDAISGLVKMSLIRRSWENADRLLPISPEVAVGALLAGQEERLLRQRQELERSRVVLAGLVSEYSGAGTVRSGTGVERLEGVDALRSRTEELANRTTCEISAFNVGPHKAAILEAALQLEPAVLERGVAIRSMYLDSAVNQPLTRAHAGRLTETGAEVRTTPTLPLCLVLFDGKAAVVPVDSQGPGGSALVVTARALLTALAALFELYWTSGTPYGRPQDVDDDGLDPSARELLRLLAAGLTDESAARQLGVSLRTVRRTMSQLTDRLDARSRFQAGAVAARRGWI